VGRFLLVGGFLFGSDLPTQSPRNRLVSQLGEMLMSTRLKVLWYALVVFGAVGPFVSPAAAVVSGPYFDAMTALAPVHWYQMDEDGFAAIGATTFPAADSGSNPIDATYVANSGQTFASPAVAQGGGDSTLASLVGPLAPPS